MSVFPILIQQLRELLRSLPGDSSVIPEQILNLTFKDGKVVGANAPEWMFIASDGEVSAFSFKYHHVAYKNGRIKLTYFTGSDAEWHQQKSAFLRGEFNDISVATYEGDTTMLKLKSGRCQKRYSHKNCDTPANRIVLTIQRLCALEIQRTVNRIASY